MTCWAVQCTCSCHLFFVFFPFFFKPNPHKIEGYPKLDLEKHSSHPEKIGFWPRTYGLPSIGNDGKPFFIGIYRGIIILGFLRGCEMDFATIHSMECFPFFFEESAAQVARLLGSSLGARIHRLRAAPRRSAPGSPRAAPSASHPPPPFG